MDCLVILCWLVILFEKMMFRDEEKMFFGEVFLGLDREICEVRDIRFEVLSCV